MGTRCREVRVKVPELVNSKAGTPVSETDSQAWAYLPRLLPLFWFNYLKLFHGFTPVGKSSYSQALELEM